MTDYINSLIGQEFVQGENDCNLIACKIIDILAGTDLYNSLYKKYSTKEEGLKICKELSGYSNILQPIKKHFKLVTDDLQDGDLLVTAHKLGKVRISTLRNENETFSQLNSITYIGVFLRLVTYSHLP
ncbi:DUF6950 family protein [Escherichia coli]